MILLGTLLGAPPLAALGAAAEPDPVGLPAVELVVRLTDEHGAPWRRLLRTAGWHPTEPARDWPDADELFVLELDRDHVPLGRLSGSTLEPGVARFELTRAPTRLLIGSWGPERGLAAQVVELPGLAQRHEIRLRAAPLVPRGSVQVAVSGPRGTPIPGDLVLRVEDPALRVVLFERRAGWSGPVGRRVTLPAGAYRFEVLDAAAGSELSPGVERLRELGSLTRGVDVIAGRDTRLEGRLAVGASVHLTLLGARRPFEDDLVQLTLLGHGAPRPLLFRHAFGPTLAGTCVGLRSALPLGAMQLSEATAAGDYELVARLADGREARAPVLLFDGLTTSVSLSFD